MERPLLAGVIALALYLVRAVAGPLGGHVTPYSYFNYLADAFLHGQLHLRLQPAETLDLIIYGDVLYLYWPPFPALLLTPLVAIFGVGLSDSIYTPMIGALTIALLAQFLRQLDRTGLAPLSPERRGLIVSAVAFGSIVLFLSTRGTAWLTSQLIGWGCVLIAAIAALAIRGRWGYFLTGLALACAATTRTGLLFNGVWIACFLLMRDRWRPSRYRATAVLAGIAPVAFGLACLGWYNAARFGSPLETGLAWHDMNAIFRDDFARYGVFNVHYLPINLYYHFLAPPFSYSQNGLGGGIFWLTPALLGALSACWRERRRLLTWALIASCLLSYVPIGLVMGTGYLFGSRYLLDLMLPLLVLAAIGIRDWRIGRVQMLVFVGIALHVTLSVVLAVLEYLP